MAMFAKMENIRIEVYSHGIPCQIYEFDGEDEQHNKHTISVRWCNINRWGAQENHYDLLIPIREEAQCNNTFGITYIDKMEENKQANIGIPITIQTTLAEGAKMRWKEAQTLPHL
eukprot:11763327-Heterocapsa_arctica.AAC.1